MMILCRRNPRKYKDLKKTCKVSYLPWSSNFLSNINSRELEGHKDGCKVRDVARPRVNRALCRARPRRSGEKFKITSGSPSLQEDIENF